MSEIATEETIVAFPAVFTEQAFETLLTIVEIPTLLRCLHISAIITRLTIVDIETIHAPRVIDTIVGTIHTILAISGIDTHITIFVVCRMVGVFSIFTAHIDKRGPRCFQA